MVKCLCNCGGETRLAPKTVSHRGVKKGQPLRYINGHNVNFDTLVQYTKENGVWNKGLTRETDKRVIAPWQGKKRPNLHSEEFKVSQKKRIIERQIWLKTNNKGENSPCWISDRSLLKDDHRDRGGQLHREWSNKVKNRDGRRCKIENTDCKGGLEAHHILGWKEYPDLRYQINNGITLCHAHHPRKRAEEKRLIPTFTELVSVSKD